MIWKTDTHLLTATTCQHTGSTCPALVRMAENLTQAMTTAKPVTTEDFEIQGNNTLTHCPKACPAKFQASHDRIRIFCGVAEEADMGRLNLFADALLSPDNRGFVSPGGPVPCAMVEALPAIQNKPDDLGLQVRV